MTLTEPARRWNQADVVLSRYALRWPDAFRAAAPQQDGPAEDDLAGLPQRGWPALHERPGRPRMGRSALTALRTASHTARDLGHPYAGTTHLLVTLLDDPAGPVGRLLAVLDVDFDALRADAVRVLGAFPEAAD
ncbi:Clp protease N-terminal domain-containing protein [Hamadaea tsunoensis]|uniref:Clp protease N-terminal domain-containing protein n=1 Tax=Hamadaea tsunoensis TaxID=53368 RepID=UPI000688BC4B|nr:Clp protease N-terminal domain-containing protein [Hamadaea tsunoensis]